MPHPVASLPFQGTLVSFPGAICSGWKGRIINTSGSIPQPMTDQKWWIEPQRVPPRPRGITWRHTSRATSARSLSGLSPCCHPCKCPDSTPSLVSFFPSLLYFPLLFQSFPRLLFPDKLLAFQSCLGGCFFWETQTLTIVFKEGKFIFSPQRGLITEPHVIRQVLE